MSQQALIEWYPTNRMVLPYLELRRMSDNSNNTQFWSKRFICSPYHTLHQFFNLHDHLLNEFALQTQST